MLLQREYFLVCRLALLDTAAVTLGVVTVTSIFDFLFPFSHG